ncbi:MAG: HAD-IIA family hydrolase [Melioribacteraceae bacterium]|nr:HAD-IIA family hydrolase [Melioribacteraceae bacterium]
MIIEKYDGFIFDLDGTIYLDDKIIPGADLIVNKIRKRGKRLIFLSNKTTGSVNDYYNFLLTSGIEINLNEIINSTIIIQNYLKKNHSNESFFAIGEKKFTEQIKRCELKYSEDPDEIDIVIVTLDRTLNYKKLEIASNALDNGARFYAANIDNTCPVVGGEILDAGAIISALEKRTGRKLEKNFGKPSKYIMDHALDLLEVEKSKCLIIGDRLETDIAMGNKFNIDTALVSTGVTKNYNIKSKYHPNYKINSVTDLLF